MATGIGEGTMDEKTKKWFDDFSLECPWHDSGGCQTITHRDEKEDFIYNETCSIDLCAVRHFITKYKTILEDIRNND